MFRLLLVDEIGGVDRRESRQASVEDQLARFNIWAGNIGVFAEGHASLDYRVRDNDDLRDLILSFFDALKDLLGRGTIWLHSNRPFKLIVLFSEGEFASRR